MSWDIRSVTLEVDNLPAIIDQAAADVYRLASASTNSWRLHTRLDRRESSLLQKQELTSPRSVPNILSCRWKEKDSPAVLTARPSRGALVRRAEGSACLPTS